MEVQFPSPKSDLKFVARNKSRACKRLFEEYLMLPALDEYDWLEQEYVESSTGGPRGSTPTRAGRDLWIPN